MKSTRRIIFRVFALLCVVVIAGLMFIIGRGHTVYFDNKSFEKDGTSVAAPYRIDVFVGEERVAKLKEDERGMASCMGQTFKMRVEVTEEKGGEPVSTDIELKVPYNMDGIVVNLPAYLAGLPEEVWMSEFVPAVVEPTSEDEEVVTDEFAGLTEGDEEA